MKKILVVGAGFFGLTIAERIANVMGLEVRVIDRRNHIGGNAHSFVEPKSQVEVHKYGIHVFHTSNEKVWNYVRQFTDFNDYRHHVFTSHRGVTFPMPISLATINQFYQRSMSPEQAKLFIASRTREFPEITNLEQKAISSIGFDLYNAFIKGYTEKQWQLDPRLLPPETIGRLPVRFDFNTRYFNDRWEGQPVDGFQSWHLQMIQNRKIKIELETDYFVERDRFADFALIIYTGPLDRYFEFKYGALGWRTLDFEHEVAETNDFQGCSQMNYADLDVPWTRILEYKHLHPERKHSEGLTAITREYSRRAEPTDEVYYPINSPEDRAKLSKYRILMGASKGILFGGRLGTYKYLDMHMAIGSALSLFETKIKSILSE